VAAFSVGTLASRLTEQRLQTVVELLRREAAIISHKISPFDPSLRQPNQALANRR
jgi:DNA-binding IclR family transcriptional regulator